MTLEPVDGERTDLVALRTFVEELGGVLTLAPRPGDGSPEISWGDLFFYYAPDGVLPPSQPFATVVTKDYPDEPASGLDRDGAFRVNVAVGTAEFTRRVGRAPREPAGEDEPAAGTPDVVLAHPVYGALGWLAAVDPGPRTSDHLMELLRTAHGLARGRHGRRAGAPAATWLPGPGAPARMTAWTSPRCAPRSTSSCGATPPPAPTHASSGRTG